MWEQALIRLALVVVVSAILSASGCSTSSSNVTPTTSAEVKASPSAPLVVTPTPSVSTIQPNTPTVVAAEPTITPTPQVPAVTPQVPASGCRSGDPLANVHHPARLQVIAPCASATGIVMRVGEESDGDVHVNLKLDAPFANLINQKNISDQHGELVVEIVPADRPGCTVGHPPRPAVGSFDFGICTGANISAPVIGQHVTVVGPYVLDRPHGWMEIHPVWSIRLIEGEAAPSPTRAPRQLGRHAGPHA